MFRLFSVMLLMTALAGCSFLGKQADKRLGEACTPEVRVERAGLLYDLLEDRHGPEFTLALVEPLQVMHESLTAGISLDPAGDAYRLAFVGVAIDILKSEGKEVAIGGFDEAVKKLRQLPSLASGINIIEAKVGISCARSLNSDPPDPLDLLPALEPEGSA